MRPGAIEIRQVARAIARDLTSAYEEMEIDGARPRAHQPRAAAQIIPTDEVYVCDPEALEFGVTEMLPVVPKPRWTPEIGRVPKIARRHPITPKSARDQVAGEIILADKRR
jgi:hypothetical protein